VMDSLSLHGKEVTPAGNYTPRERQEQRLQIRRGVERLRALSTIGA
jgi:hypothetical protein